MRKSFPLLGFLLVCFGVRAAAYPARAIPPPLQGVRVIVCIGDSITQAGDEPGGYVWLTRRYLSALYPQQRIKLVNLGIGGQKSNDMLARFRQDVVSRKPNLVLINVGVNDVWHSYLFARGVPLDSYRNNVEQMVVQAQRAGARVLLISPTIIRENLDNGANQQLALYLQAMQDIARKHKTLFVDMQQPFRRLITAYRESTGARDNLLTIDGVHMNRAGNRVMAHALLSGLGVTPQARALVRSQIEKELRVSE